MDYTVLPQVQVNPQQVVPNNQTGFKNLFGSANVPPGSVFNVGGPAGVSIGGGQGIWAGDQSFGSAPFSVDLQGNVVANSATVKGSIVAGSSISIPPHFSVDSNGNLTASSVSITGSSGSVVDGTGLVSTTQFTYGSTTVNSGANTTTTDLSASVPSLTVTFTLARSANVFLFATAGLYNDEAYTSDLCLAQLADNGTLIGPIVYSAGTPWAANHASFPAAGNVTPNVTTINAIVNLAAGSHTISYHFASVFGNTAGVGVTSNTIGYIVLGK